jgi:hypothetical protein
MNLHFYGNCSCGGDPMQMPVTKQDILNLKEYLDMKLSLIKAAVVAAAAKNTEAFAELGALVALLQQQLADAIANASDPEVTDEAFLASLDTITTTANKLADIVPNTAEEPEVVTEEPKPEDPKPVDPTA